MQLQVLTTLVSPLFILMISCHQPEKPQQAFPAADTSAKPISHPDTSPVQKTAQTPHDASPDVNFIPQGYSFLDSAVGDVNLDAYPDKILVLKKDGEDTSSDVINHPEKRPLLILTGEANNTYKLAARSDSAVYCVDCGGAAGDPFLDVVIKKGYFSVEHAGGSNLRWTRTTTFKYSPNDHYWYLHKDGHGSFQASDPGKTETTMYTTKNFGKVPFNKFNIYKEE